MKKMDHINYPKKLKELPVESLCFIAKDAKEAIIAMPTNPNNSYYFDEINYVAMELSNRGICRIN